MLHAAAANPDLACGFLFSGQSSGVALELFLEAQPRVCFLPSPPHPPPHFSDSGNYDTVTNLLLCELVRTDSVLCS